MIRLSVLQMVQAVSGMMTAGPMFYQAVEFLQSGAPVAGVFMGGMGLAGFFLPGYLLSRFLDHLIGLKRRAIAGLVAPVPASVLRLLGVTPDSHTPESDDAVE